MHKFIHIYLQICIHIYVYVETCGEFNKFPDFFGTGI